MDSLLFVNQLKGVLFNLAVVTAFIVFVPVVGLLMYASLASTLQTSSSPSLRVSLHPSCVRLRSLCGFLHVKYVTWFLEFIYWHILNYAKAPGPFEDRGEMAMAIARSPGPPVRSTSVASFSPLYSFAVPGAAGHNRGEAAERQPLARTQGRNLDRVLTFKPTPCVGCLLTPRGRPTV